MKIGAAFFCWTHPWPLSTLFVRREGKLHNLVRGENCVSHVDLVLKFPLSIRKERN